MDIALMNKYYQEYLQYRHTQPLRACVAYINMIKIERNFK